jgi:hypothetical protein
VRLLRTSREANVKVWVFVTQRRCLLGPVDVVARPRSGETLLLDAVRYLVDRVDPHPILDAPVVRVTVE